MRLFLPPNGEAPSGPRSRDRDPVRLLGVHAAGLIILWGQRDPKIEGLLDAVPYLKKLGVTPENLIYKFDYKGVRFIFLWSGKYDYRSPSMWDGDRPKYAEQMPVILVSFASFATIDY
jgi:hypothetical protein